MTASGHRCISSARRRFRFAPTIGSIAALRRIDVRGQRQPLGRRSHHPASGMTSSTWGLECRIVFTVALRGASRTGFSFATNSIAQMNEATLLITPRSFDDGFCGPLQLYPSLGSPACRRCSTCRRCSHTARFHVRQSPPRHFSTLPNHTLRSSRIACALSRNLLSPFGPAL